MNPLRTTPEISAKRLGKGGGSTPPTGFSPDKPQVPERGAPRGAAKPQGAPKQKQTTSFGNGGSSLTREPSKRGKNSMTRNSALDYEKTKLLYTGALESGAQLRKNPEDKNLRDEYAARMGTLERVYPRLHSNAFSMDLINKQIEAGNDSPKLQGLLKDARRNASKALGDSASKRIDDKRQ